MKIQYCSDLHIEFPENTDFLKTNPIKPVGDILIMAGDITLLREKDNHDYFFNYLSKNFKYTFWLPGNHEYYHHYINVNNSQMYEEIRDNVFLINNNSYVFDQENIKIIFSTLWSRIEDKNKYVIKSKLNDFRYITNVKHEPITVDVYNKLHKESIEFIQNELENNKSAKTIVVSHHVPTYLNYPTEYLNSPINNAFVTRLDDLIERFDINYWIFGHHHKNISEFKIGDTTMLTNQLGYVAHGEHKSFRNDAVIEL